MDELNQFIRNNQEMVITGCAIISAIVTFFTLQNTLLKPNIERNLDIDKKTFMCVIQPVFSMIEPVLFKNLSKRKYEQLLTDIELILNSNTPYSYPYATIVLKSKNELKSGEKSCHKSFIAFCSYFDKQYDKKSKKLHYPLRSLEYRKVHEQYKSISSMRIHYLVTGLKIFMKYAFIVIGSIIIIAVMSLIALTLFYPKNL